MRVRLLVHSYLYYGDTCLLYHSCVQCTSAWYTLRNTHFTLKGTYLGICLCICYYGTGTYSTHVCTVLLRYTCRLSFSSLFHLLCWYVSLLFCCAHVTPQIELHVCICAVFVRVIWHFPKPICHAMSRYVRCLEFCTRRMLVKLNILCARLRTSGKEP